MMKTITWQQVIVLVACLAAAILAHKFLGSSAGMVTGLATSIVAFLMGRHPGDPR